MDQLGIGVIGVGLMGSLFARLAAQLPDSRLVGLADVDTVRAGALGVALGAPIYRDYRELLSLPTLDAVVIATPDAQHLAPAVDAVRAGKHLLIEKPLATTGEDALAIVETARAASVTLMTAHVLRFDPHYGEARKAVRAGKLGEVVHVNSRRSTTLSDGTRLAGRVTVTHYLGSHDLDIVQWVIGSPIVEVTAVGVAKALKQFHVDDTVMALLRFANGAIGAQEMSFIRPQAAAARRLGASLMIMGTEGAFKVEPVADNATLYLTDRALLSVPNYGFDETEYGVLTGVYRDELAHFVHCARTGSKPVISPEQALATVRVCDAIEQSLKRGQTVCIDQPDVYAFD